MDEVLELLAGTAERFEEAAHAARVKATQADSAGCDEDAYELRLLAGKLSELADEASATLRRAFALQG